ncbi:MAG: VOC family protein [Acidobacteria bacterium]|nr:MAG: VOC family protein [Acidobacteriota bacterium]REJ98173.1 MAG: VOC family protein [Acidobacteriota bacterium]REK16916.1 MAG: VOC family protein [Acidobacteriota bacterium]REK42827.1 MAG: VOC family protein [Acidobacteriota bacterium]
MTKLVPHIAFNGNCEEALNHYKDAFGGEIEFAQRYGDSPMADQVPEEYGSKIMHATFSAEGIHFMAADSMPGHEAPAGSNIDLSVMHEDADEQARVFEKLAEGGEVKMPLQDTFWGAHFGMVKDRFGIGWMLNRELESQD